MTCWSAALQTMKDRHSPIPGSFGRGDGASRRWRTPVDEGTSRVHDNAIVRHRWRAIACLWPQPQLHLQAGRAAASVMRGSTAKRVVGSGVGGKIRGHGTAWRGRVDWMTGLSMQYRGLPRVEERDIVEVSHQRGEASIHTPFNDVDRHVAGLGLRYGQHAGSMLVGRPAHGRCNRAIADAPRSVWSQTTPPSRHFSRLGAPSFGDIHSRDDMAELESAHDLTAPSSSGDGATKMDLAPPDLAGPAPKPSQIYAFLNHSTATVSDSLPPTVDDKSLARQRRRRTRYNVRCCSTD